MATPGSWWPAYVALGANLGDPIAQLQAAFAALAELSNTRLIARSRLYRTEPVGFVEQPAFVNAAAALLTQQDPEALHESLRVLETRLGKRAPAVRNGPRHIDLDLLAYADLVREAPALTLPHPRLHERAFVLYPLSELAPELWIPGRGRVAALRDAVGPRGIEALKTAA